MEDIEIGIIGGTRGMGKWFGDFLIGRGCRVNVSGSSTGMTLAEMAGSCQVVVVSVPIGITTEIISKIGPLMAEGALLIDLTSLKEEPVRAMLQYSRSEVIGCHPLFGPQVESLQDQHVVLCRARTKNWYPWLKGILEEGGALLVETTPAKHDEIMSLVQGLNHFNTIMMGMVLSKTAAPLSQLDQFTTPFFDIKAAMIKKIFSENPRLYTEIICTNKKMATLIETYEQILGDLKSLVIKGDADELASKLQKAASRLWPSED